MPHRQLVLDASTAILLAKVDLLREVTSRGAIIMAETAVDEALAKDSDDASMIRSLLDEQSIGRVAAPAGADALMRDFRIDRGEAETIAVARVTGATCATDDGPAIRCCRALGISFTTAIGLQSAMAEADAGRVSLGTLAHKLDVPLSEAIDLLAEFGVRSPVEYDDYLKGLSTATAFVKTSKA
jgi:predicted nucleic acid-binding protein